MKRNLGYGFLTLKQRMCAACAGHFASRVPTLTLPQLPTIPQQPVRCITSFSCIFSYSIEAHVHTTLSHTVFNGRLHGKSMSIFKLCNIKDIMQWKSDSVHFISDNFLSIHFSVQSSGHESLFFTERVECSLKDYLGRFPNKFELQNPTVIIPEIRHIVKGVLEIFSKYSSDKKDFRHIHFENLYWTGRKVVGVMFRKDSSAKDSSDLDALKATLTEMFVGTLPVCLEELLTQIDQKSLSLKYLLDNHYSQMGSEERISYRTYVVRNILEGPVRLANKTKLENYWNNDPICQRVQAVPWKTSLGGTYGGGSNTSRWNRQQEDPIQYLIMARNLGEQNSHYLTASQIDNDVIVHYSGHADAILVCIYALHPHLNFVKLWKCLK
ncbi:hypothetical protein ACFX2I_036924 [Malus domestica]|uniref:uncharacterized protein n=1 Tax=Malus domestica TaxID=3750 RepID=UPI0010AA4124|nr:uncharacterized protein LOC103434496 [Malus domestica]